MSYFKLLLVFIRAWVSKPYRKKLLDALRIVKNQEQVDLWRLTNE